MSDADRLSALKAEVADAVRSLKLLSKLHDSKWAGGIARSLAKALEA